MMLQPGVQVMSVETHSISVARKFRDMRAHIALEDALAHPEIGRRLGE
jgi:hypothetical protein